MNIYHSPIPVLEHQYTGRTCYILVETHAQNMQREKSFSFSEMSALCPAHSLSIVQALIYWFQEHRAERSVLRSEETHIYIESAPATVS